MDNSEIYIKMCKKATEIQRHETEFMDWYVCRTHHRVLEPDGMYYSEYGCPDSSIDPKSLIWLPRQDQLQEMVKLPLEQLIEAFYIFITECEHYNHVQNGLYISISKLPQFIKDSLLQMTSMEQLWLAAVMHWNFNKMWNGEDWKFAEQPSAAR